MQDPNEDTEWNDALRKHGIIGPREPKPEDLALEAADLAMAETVARLKVRESRPHRILSGFACSETNTRLYSVSHQM